MTTKKKAQPAATTSATAEYTAQVFAGCCPIALLDLESLDTLSTSVILSAGFVMFDLHRIYNAVGAAQHQSVEAMIEHACKLLSDMYRTALVAGTNHVDGEIQLLHNTVEFNQMEQQLAGRTVSEATLGFWRTQNHFPKQVQTPVAESTKTLWSSMCCAFMQILSGLDYDAQEKAYADFRLLARGSHFDISATETLFSAIGITSASQPMQQWAHPHAWHYRAPKCSRSVLDELVALSYGNLNTVVKRVTGSAQKVLNKDLAQHFGTDAQSYQQIKHSGLAHTPVYDTFYDALNFVAYRVAYTLGRGLKIERGLEDAKQTA